MAPRWQGADNTGAGDGATEERTAVIPGSAALLGIEAHQLRDFSANINPLGMPESVRRALIDNLALAERYPDVEYPQLHLALAEHHRISASWIPAGNGETESILRSFTG